MKTYKVTKISTDGTCADVEFYCNEYGAYENAITWNMELHNIPAHNWIDKTMREKFTSDVWLPKRSRFKAKDRAYVNHDDDVYCIAEQ